jgi:hypothetical protein
MSEELKARRGDLAIVRTQHHDYIIGEGPSAHDEFTVGVVTNITRDGAVKAYRPVGYDNPVQIAYLGRQLVMTYLIPQGRIDVTAALDTAAKRTWTGISGDTPKYYDTLDEVKAALRPHLIKTLGSAR